MVSKFFESEFVNKVALTKKTIVRFYVNNGSSTLAELAKELDLSIPTTTKLVGELIEEGVIQDFGKQGTGIPVCLQAGNPKEIMSKGSNRPSRRHKASG